MAWTPLKTAIQVGDETAWGTPVTVNTPIGTMKSFTPDNRWELLEIAGCGDGREVQNFVKVRFNCRPTTGFEVHNFAFLKYFVGPLAGAGTTASHYTVTEADYTGVTANTNIIPATIECGSDGSTDDADTYTGCYGDSFSLDATVNGVLSCTAHWICKKLTSSTSATAYTPLTTHPWTLAVEGTFKYGTTPDTIAGLRNLSINYSNGLIVYGDWNTEFIVQPEAGERRITFNATVVMSAANATAIRDEFYGQANTPIDDAAYAEPTADKELHVVFSQGSSSTHRQAQILLDQCVIEGIGKPINWGSNDVVLLNFFGRAKTSKSNVFAEWWTTT